MEKGFERCRYDYSKKKLTDGVATTTRNMKSFIETSLKDPAPHVQGQIDWNFNRGSLGMLENKEQNFLVHLQNEKTVRLLEVLKENPLKVSRSLRTEERFANEVMVSGNKFIGFRTKNAIRVANLSKLEQLEDDDEIEAADIYDYSHVDEVIASSFYKDQLIALDSNYNLVKYDLKCKAVNYRFQFPPNTTSNLLSLLPFNVNAVYEPRTTMKFTYTNAQEFGSIDFRASIVNKLTSMPFNKHIAMKCEKIYNHYHSLKHENLTYIVSSHMLYCIDHRNFKYPLVQWAHQIADQPMMITSTLYSQNEVICVASNTPGDLKIFNFDGKAINHLPCTPLSIQNSLNNLHEKGHFLLSDEIKERVNFSTTGIVLKAEEKRLRLRLFTQNAAGDIFQGVLTCHKYTPRSKEKELYDHFNEWDFLVTNTDTANVFLSLEERVKREEFVVSDIMRMDGLAKVLTCESLQFNDPANDIIFDSEAIVQPKWKVSIEKALTYQDVLAKEILNVWDDIDPEDIQSSFLAGALDRTDLMSECSSDRVTKWLRAANDTNVIIEEISFTDNVDKKPVSTQIFPENENLQPAATSTQIFPENDLQATFTQMLTEDGTQIVLENGTQYTIVEVNEKKKTIKKPRVVGF